MHRVNLGRYFTALLLGFWGLSAWAGGDAISELVRTRVETIREADQPRVAERRIASVGVLPALYEARDFRPIWDEEKTAQLLEAVRGAEAEGLNPQDYHLAVLEGLMPLFGGDDSAATMQRKVALDILLTDSLIRLAYHFHYGKVDAVALDANWNGSRSLGRRDAVVALQRLLDADSLTSELRRLLPDHPLYARLRDALGRYRALRAGGGWEPLDKGPTLRLGDQGPRVGSLRRRLAAEGYTTEAGSEPTLFDSALAAAVKRFQSQHYLEPDGAVGRATLAELNVPPAGRIDQIRVNLERARWVLHLEEPRYVIVDIAGFEVLYFDAGETVWRSRVQVGTPYRATPVFRDEITYLVLNPSWTIPPSVLKKDVLLEVKRDLGYLERRNIKVLDFEGKAVDPGEVDWSQYPANGFPYMLRQDPGPENALGRVKIMFPNPHAIYLHDTPSKSLFEKSQRTFSSGCIRVEKPFELAELLLDDPRAWNLQKLLQAVGEGQTRTVRLGRPVPILLLYWTVSAHEGEAVRFRRDIYDRDGAVLWALDGEFGFHRNHSQLTARQEP